MKKAKDCHKLWIIAFDIKIVPCSILSRLIKKSAIV